MAVTTRATGPSAVSAVLPPRASRARLSRHPLGDAEIHFLWWFVQGSIMNPETRDQLRRAWGMCARHSCGYVAVDAALRHGWLHGPALLYEDLMERAVSAVSVSGPLRQLRVARRLSSSATCLMCDAKLEGLPAPASSLDLVDAARDLGQLMSMAAATRRYWEALVCGACAGTASPVRCRRHLVADLDYGRIDDLVPHRMLLVDLAHHLVRYARSFRVEQRGTESEEDRAALIAAVGWCSGWQTILDVLGGGPAA
jgi:hypothetical protein